MWFYIQHSTFNIQLRKLDLIQYVISFTVMKHKKIRNKLFTFAIWDGLISSENGGKHAMARHKLVGDLKWAFGMMCDDVTNYG